MSCLSKRGRAIAFRLIDRLFLYKKIKMMQMGSPFT